MMRFLVVVIALILLQSCGYESWEPGLHGSAKQIQRLESAELKAEFEVVKACSGFEFGEFDDIAIFARNDNFTDCTGLLTGGCFYPANKIEIAMACSNLCIKTVFRHEVIHFLFFENTGNPINDHTNKIFEVCVYQ